MTRDALVVDVSQDWAVACDVQQRFMQGAVAVYAGRGPSRANPGLQRTVPADARAARRLLRFYVARGKTGSGVS
jgi:hypothetical protein